MFTRCCSACALGGRRAPRAAAWGLGPVLDPAEDLGPAGALGPLVRRGWTEELVLRARRGWVAELG